MTNNANDPLIGKVLHGRYEITQVISQGGQGKVYKANQCLLNRTVAVKVLNIPRYPDPKLQQRFFLEASLSARLNHPHIVQILDYGCTDDDIYYFAMEFIDGRTLASMLRNHRTLPPARALKIVKQICSALVEAHKEGFIHRDLKLSNVLITQQAFEEDFIKLLDFGIAKDMSKTDNLTVSGQIIGSPRYMAPEQISNQQQDGRTDLYALGGMLFTLLTGRPPFLRASILDILRDHLETQPPRLSQVNPKINAPEALEEIVKTALMKSKSKRYPDARAMYEALDSCEKDLTLSSSSPPVKPDVAAPGPQFKEAIQTVISDPAHSFRAALANPVHKTPLPTAIERIQQRDLSGHVVFSDLNCPFCYALHERLARWGIAHRFEWRLVEHASHILDGPFGLEQEGILSNEVVAVHHRAPDVELLLPPKRMCSTEPNRLLVYLQHLHPEQYHAFRGTLYRALWRDGLDIGQRDVLRSLLEQEGLPGDLVELGDEAPFELEIWQKEWEKEDFDCCIPVIYEQSSGAVLIGLPSEQNLVDFLLGERSLMVDSTVCHYQRKPIVIICGWISHLWQLVQDLRHCCELIQTASVEEAKQAMSNSALPDLLIIEREHIKEAGIEELALLARKRSIYWVTATNQPEPDDEVQMLSMGATEYLPLKGAAEVARARLARLLRARFNLERIQHEAMTDNLTGLPSRRQFIDRLESEWERGVRSGVCLSLMMLRLEHFKTFNTQHGYFNGDELLKKLATVLQEEINRPGDFLARFGTDEFAVLLPATGGEATLELGRQLVVASRTLLGRYEAESDPLTLSLGHATLLPTKAASIHDLFERANRSSHNP